MFKVLFLLFAFLALAIPVYVMMPLDTINSEGRIANPDWVKSKLHQLKEGGVHGIMTDVWWGIAERAGPKSYDFSGWAALAEICKNEGLKMQAVMSFHKCGGNVGDECNIPLPAWIFSQSHKSIFYRDREGRDNDEYLTLGVDHQPLWDGRSAIMMYEDFMHAFARHLGKYLSSVVTEIQVGVGPCGELRYPAYPSSRWSFPHIGEFQCYDTWMRASLKDHAAKAGHPEWPDPPSDAGDYNSNPDDTGFFTGGYKSEYGHFFLDWYSSSLIAHGKDVLDAARRAFSGKGVEIAAKVAGVHWWFLSESHAAENTAGYYNTRDHDGYKPIAQMMASKNVVMDFTCFEMHDEEQPSWAGCGPYELVTQSLNAAQGFGTRYSAENALKCYDDYHYDQIVHNSNRVFRIGGLTYLRLTGELVDNEDNWNRFKNFVSRME